MAATNECERIAVVLWGSDPVAGLASLRSLGRHAPTAPIHVSGPEPFVEALSGTGAEIASVMPRSLDHLPAAGDCPPADAVARARSLQTTPDRTLLLLRAGVIACGDLLDALPREPGIAAARARTFHGRGPADLYAGFPVPTAEAIYPGYLAAPASLLAELVAHDHPGPKTSTRLVATAQRLGVAWLSPPGTYLRHLDAACAVATSAMVADVAAGPTPRLFDASDLIPGARPRSPRHAVMTPTRALRDAVVCGWDNGQSGIPSELAGFMAALDDCEATAERAGLGVFELFGTARQADEFYRREGLR